MVKTCSSKVPKYQYHFFAVCLQPSAFSLQYLNTVTRFVGWYLPTMQCVQILPVCIRYVATSLCVPVSRLVPSVYLRMPTHSRAAAHFSFTWIFITIAPSHTTSLFTTSQPTIHQPANQHGKERDQYHQA